MENGSREGDPLAYGAMRPASGGLDPDIPDFTGARRDEDESWTTTDRAVLDHLHGPREGRLDLDGKRLPALGTVDQDFLQPVHRDS